MKIFFYLISLVFIAKSVLSCGSTSLKIINGQTASTWPWTVSLTSSSTNQHFCGGSLISSQYVLTAAHCLTSSDSFYIVAGTNDLTDSSKTTYQVESKTLHESYDSSTYQNDIALVKLTQPITESSKISTICLPSSSDENTIINQQVYTAGWGYTTPSGPVSSILYQTTMKIYQDAATCQFSTTLHYCALDSSSQESNVCFGDSGGPLMYQSNGIWYLYGLTSYGSVDNSNNCINTNPSYFTKVPKYIDWINANMDSSSSTSSSVNSGQVTPSSKSSFTQSSPLVVLATTLALICL